MLTQLEIVNGLLSTIVVVISITTGVRMMLKYKTHKQRVFIFFGITWAGMCTIYIPLVISFWGLVLFRQGLTLFWYLFIDSFVPLIITVAVMAWTELLFKKYQKQLVGLMCIQSAIVCVFFFYNTFMNPPMLGSLEGHIVIRYSFFTLLYLTATAILAFVTGTIFYINSRDAPEPEVRLKGLLIWIAFISFFTGTLLDGFLPISMASVHISRFALIFGSIAFFFGFFPPKFAQEYVKQRVKNKKM